MNNMIKSLLLFLLLFYPARFSLADSPAMLSVAPHTFDLSAQAGDEIRQKIKIYNRGDTAIPIRIRMAGFGAEEETGDMIEDNSQDSILGWLEFEKQDFIADPGKTEEVNFTVKIPADAEHRGYYAVIFLEADISTYIYNESKLQAIPGIGIPFMLKIGEEQTTEPLAILEYSISNADHLEKTEKALNFLTRPFAGGKNEIAVVKPGEPSFTVRLKNNSPYHAKLSGQIKLSGLGWKMKNELEFPPITILPGKTRKVLVENKLEKDRDRESALIIPAVLAAEGGEKTDAKTGFGLMKARLDIESDKGIRKEASRWIVVFSWWIVFLSLVVIAAAVAIAAFLIKRKKLSGKLNENLSAEKIKPGKISGEKASPEKKQPEEKIKEEKIQKNLSKRKRKAKDQKNKRKLNFLKK